VKPFLEALREAPLLWDGAMGSLLYERGVFLTRCFDELNLSQPELILQVHRDYVAAGADVIETNTFGANRLALAKHGYAEKLKDIIYAGVKLARQASEGRAYVAGAVGPTGVHWPYAAPHERHLAASALEESVSTLAAAGVDLLLLETFPWVDELEIAIAAAKKHGAGLAVVAQVMPSADGKLAGGVAPLAVAERLKAAGADVVGVNCGSGPNELFELGVAMLPCGLPVSVQPNAGLPRVVDGRTIYVANPENFGVYARRMLQAGIRMVGGCCGTTPEHTRRMLGAVRMIGARPLPTRVSGGTARAAQAPAQARPAVPLAERSQLAAKLAAGKFVVSCELSSPAGTSAEKTIAAARRLKEGGVDVVNVADGPRATARMGNLATCALVQQGAGMETILHVCCRDRNLLGQVAHLLAAQALGLRNLVIITGDPPKMGDYPFATPVYDLDSIGLLKLAADLNRGLDPGGKEIAGQTSFLLATGAEPAALDYDRELRRLEQKILAGAELVMTQPVYDGRLIERFLDDVKSFKAPVMVGLLPLASHRNAEFIHNEVPGMRIPEEIRARMAKVGQGPAARAEGVKIAQEALTAVKARVAGAYIMPPFDRVDAALEILKVL
jgi:homocysteine S-methyltransferase